MSYRHAPYAPYARQSYTRQGDLYVVHRPSAVVPQTAQAPIFEVHGGPVKVHQLVGKLTAAADATASNLSAVADLDSGLADVSLNTATAIANLGVGTLLALSGAGIGVALSTGGAASGMNQPIAVDSGDVDLLTTGNNATASPYWLMLYEALTPGAFVTPVLPTAGMRGLDTVPVGPMRRARRRAAVIPATAQDDIFSIQGGPVLLWALIGKVTTAADATATNLTVVANPTSGLADVNLCTATAIANTAVNNLLSLAVAGIGTALQIGGAARSLLTPIIVDVGTIDLLTSATNPMAAEWTALWQPLHPAGRLIVS